LTQSAPDPKAHKNIRNAQLVVPTYGGRLDYIDEKMLSCGYLWRKECCLPKYKGNAKPPHRATRYRTESVNRYHGKQELILKPGKPLVRKWVIGILGFVLPVPVVAATAHTNPMNYDPQVRAAFDRFYNLDYPGAVEGFQQFHAAHPGDPQATAYLLNTLIFQELYRQDLLDTTFYANDGFLTGRHATDEDPAMRDQIFALADEAVREADWRISKNPNDADALFARAWVRSLRCAYVAMVERAFSTGFRLATKAKDDAARALEIDPDYVDAKLITGVYEYVVGALPWPFKIMIGFAGITGSKSTGLAMLEDSGSRGVITSVESRTVIALFLRRESRYKEAIQVVRDLKSEYPHDFLFCLEEANLRKDAGEGVVAVDSYRQLLADAAKPGYFASSRLELAYFGLGDALRGQRHYDEAAQAYERAASTRGVGSELKIRSLLDAGRCHDMNSQRALATRDYQAAIDAGPNTSRAGEARKYLHTPYQGN
jgi:tetratricopeptide (TPR) repeat protein